jgi:hypothetical protein
MRPFWARGFQLCKGGCKPAQQPAVHIGLLPVLSAHWVEREQCCGLEDGGGMRCLQTGPNRRSVNRLDRLETLLASDSAAGTIELPNSDGSIRRYHTASFRPDSETLIHRHPTAEPMWLCSHD